MSFHKSTKYIINSRKHFHISTKYLILQIAKILYVKKALSQINEIFNITNYENVFVKKTNFTNSFLSEETIFYKSKDIAFHDIRRYEILYCE